MTKELSEKQLKAIPMLVQGIYNKDVAEALGVTPQTICNWKSNNVFQAAMNEAKWSLVHSTMDKLRVGADQAAALLLHIAKHAENEETRRKACLNLLEFTGLKNPQEGGVGMGIGSTDPTKLKKGGSHAFINDFADFHSVIMELLAQDEDDEEGD